MGCPIYEGMSAPTVPVLRVRGWWWFAGAVLVPVVVACMPVWLHVLVPLRWVGFPSGVGKLGGLPRTRFAKAYNTSLGFRLGLWCVAWWCWVLLVALGGPVVGLQSDALMWLVLTLPFGLGWWWHLERVLGRRRLVRWLRSAPSDFEQTLVAVEMEPEPPVRSRPVEVPFLVPEVPVEAEVSAGDPGGSVVVDTVVQGVEEPVSEQSLGALLGSATVVGAAVLPYAPAERWSATDLRWRKAGTSARLKAAQERAAGVPEHRLAASWLRGAEGEEIVAQVLSALPSDWVVLHDVSVGVHGANIDHVVIGPAGVFTVNTKHYKGARVEARAFGLMVRGGFVDHPMKASVEAERASGLLGYALGSPVEVQPMLVYVNARSVTVKPDWIGPLVCTERDVVQTLLSQPAVAMPSWALEGLVAVATRPATWTVGTSPRRVHAETMSSRPAGAGCLGVVAWFGASATAVGAATLLLTETLAPYL